jgi:hypothetical protein
MWKSQGKRPLGRLRYKWDGCSKIDLQIIRIRLPQNMIQWRTFVKIAMDLQCYISVHSFYWLVQIPTIYIKFDIYKLIFWNQRHVCNCWCAHIIPYMPTYILYARLMYPHAEDRMANSNGLLVINIDQKAKCRCHEVATSLLYV